MTKRIFRSILAVAMTVLLASLVLIVGVLHGYFQDQTGSELASLAEYIAHGVEEIGEDYLAEDLPGGYRVTWVDADGTVLFDNRQDAGGHGGPRPAGRRSGGQAALGRGRAVRYSETLSQATVYSALRLTDGSVLRLATTQYSVWMLVLQALQPVAAGDPAGAVPGPVAGGPAVPAAGGAHQRHRPRTPGGPGDLRGAGPHCGQDPQPEPADPAAAGGSAPPAGGVRLHHGAHERGLLVIDQETRVLSFNAAALRLLRCPAPAEEGESVLALNREAGFRRCVEEALAGRRCEELLEQDDACCRIFANPVEQDGQLTGAVLIIVDVTEQERREILRREFAANVSHELKTPLTSILGTAEILRDGLVQPGDIAHFAGNIHREAQRLIGLVNDIIELSRLDEGGPTAEWVPVDLRQVAQSVVEQLAPAAERKHVTVTLAGECAPIRGVPQIVEEVIYNLCDNAIAYNRPGGSVRITLTRSPAEAAGSPWRTPASASPGRCRAGCSSGSTGWTRATPAAARGWASPSSSTGRPIWAAGWSSAASPAAEAPFRSPSRRSGHKGLQFRRTCGRIVGDQSKGWEDADLTFLFLA